MTVSRHKIIKAIESHLSPHNIKVVGDEMMKRHRRVWITDGENTRFITVSLSPSDKRGFLNLVKDAKKTLREAP